MNKNTTIFKTTFASLALIVMLLVPGMGWGQTSSYLGLDGGFEGSATIDNTPTGANVPVAGKWSKANGFITIANETTTVRSGVNSLKVSSSTSSTSRIWSPLVTISASTTKWVVQYYRRATSLTACVQNQTYNYRGTTEAGNGSYSTVAAINTWEKVTYAPTATASATQGAAGLLGKMMTTAGDTYYDDFCLYESATGVDTGIPDPPTASSVTPASATTLTVSWTAPVTGVDGGGYLVVRGLSDPTTAPLVNGIYAVTNTVAAGMTVVYRGTGTSFVDAGLTTGTLYYYRIYTFDKAYNYSSALTGSGTPSGSSIAPTVTTQAVNPIGVTTATGNGTITATGGENAHTRGVCWVLYSNVSDPTTSDANAEETGGSFGAVTFTESMTSNLAAETRYKLKAYAINTIETGYGSLVDFWTRSTEPSAHSSTFSNSIVSQVQIDLSFDAASTIANADGYIILKKTGSAPTGTPTDGNAYSVGTTIGDGTVAAIVASTSATSANITGLTAGTSYFFTIMPYNYNGANNETYNYKTDGSIPSTNGTTAAPLDATSEVSGPALGGQPNPVLISSLVTTDAAAVRGFDMDVYDYGTDGQPTKITQVTIKAGTGNTANWLNTIQGVKLSINGGTSFATIGTPTITASSIVIPITSGNLNIPDADAKTLSMFIYLKSSGLTDNQVFEFKVDATASSHGFTADLTGSTFLATFASAPVSNQILIDVVATKLKLVQQPSPAIINATMSPAVTVESTDANNNRDLNKSGSVALASTGTMTGPVTASLTSGFGTFGNIVHTAAGTGLTLTASLSGLTDAVSSTFNISLVPALTELVVPQYFGSKTAASANNARTPIAVCLQIDNLNPSTAYDIKAGLALTSEASTSFGAGNFWSTSFSTTSISNAFTTNGSGSSGPFWVFIQPTGNASRFDAGQVHDLRIGYIANGGTMPASPNFVGAKTLTALDIATTARTPATTDDGAFIKGTANVGATGKYILLYDNESGTGNPLFAYQIRSATATSTTQTDLPASLNDIYLQSGTSAIGDYPAVIPIGANNSNGVRRIEARNADNTIYSYNTDPDGIWSSGANTTTVLRRGVVTLTNQDAPVYPTIWNGTTWDNGDPSATKNAIINDNLSLSNDLTSCGLIINSGKVLTVNSGRNVTVTGTLTNSATATGLVIESGGSLLNNTAGVTATVKRDIPSDSKWHFLSSPVAGQIMMDGNFAPAVFNSSTGATYDFFQWSELVVPGDLNWINLKKVDWSANTASFGTPPQFASNTGYLVEYLGTFGGSTTKAFAGTLHSGDQSVTLTTGGNTWNLIGNPFSSAINWDNVTKTNIDGGYYFIYNEAKAGGSGYEFYADVTHASTGGTGKISATQGFFVKATGPSLTLPYTARIHDNGWLKSEESQPVNRLKITLGNVTNFDETFIIFETGGNVSKATFDADKMFSLDGNVPQVYTVKENGRKTCFNSMPLFTEALAIPVGLAIQADGSYTFRLSGLETFPTLPGIVLEDLKTHATQNMAQTPVYAFTAAKSDDPNRFLLRFTGNIGIGEQPAKDDFRFYVSDNSLFVANNAGKDQGTVYVYNMMGQLLAQQKLSGEALTTLRLNAPTGYYLVKVITDNQVYSGKIFVN